jgi:drug/metabolite transporter (DMT)-like permease
VSQAPQDPPPSTDDAQTWAWFLALSAIWGSSFLFIRISLDEGIPPFTIVALRALIGSVFLAIAMRLIGGRLPRRREAWKRLLILALSNIVVPFALIAWSQQFIPSGMASILNAMVPLFTIVLAATLLHDEALTMARLGGLAVGFSGVVLLALPSFGAAFEDAAAVRSLAAMAAVALGTVSYAFAAVYTRHRLTGQPLFEAEDGSLRPPRSQEIALGSTLAAVPAIGALALLVERPESGVAALPQTGTGWFAILWLGVLGTGCGYLLFFGIMERWGATRTTLVTYVIPVVAVLLGFVVLGERLDILELVGAALIICGVALVNGSAGQRPLLRAARAGSRLDG